MGKYTFIALSYSPWSDKARWALRHHLIPFRERPYLPLIGAPLARLRSGKWRGPLSVPMLITKSQTLSDSLEIARFANRNGSGTNLFPDDHLNAIEQWNQCAESLMRAGRALLIVNMQNNRDAKIASLPHWLPLPIRRRSVFVADYVLRHLQRKYQCDQHTHKEWLDRMRSELQKLRSAAKPYLCGQFTFADIAMSLSMQFVAPCDSRFLYIEPDIRPCWQQKDLESEFQDLLDWRDHLLVRHHPHRSKVESSSGLP